MTRRKGRIKKQPAGKQELLVRIMAIFQHAPNELLNYKQIAKRMGINDEPTRRLLPSLLHHLETNKQIKEFERGKYKLNFETGCITGKVDMTAHGYAYIRSLKTQDIYDILQRKERRRQDA